MAKIRWTRKKRTK
ncbi:BnaC02g23880D [Brassica napus]|uniref:BnaC02g23880D protein n=3 Tax=Brassica TaxID=3705 RepID=A0A078G728_BRANA|nr:BnaC02g23880D [Brassica napus]